MVKSETKGITRADMDKMFDVTQEKKDNMASFKGKRTLKLPEIGNKTGLTIRPLWSTDDTGNRVPVLQVKSDSPKMKSQDGTMLTMTVEDFESPGEECSIPYPKSLDYSFVGWAESRKLKYDDIFGKWFRIIADEYDNPKAPSGKAKGYRAIYREDLNQVVSSEKRKAATEF